MPDKRDYYEVLGVDKTADEKTIKNAYRKLASLTFVMNQMLKKSLKKLVKLMLSCLMMKNVKDTISSAMLEWTDLLQKISIRM